MDGLLPALSTSEFPPFNKTDAHASPAIAPKQDLSEDILARLVAEAVLSVVTGNCKTFDVDECGWSKSWEAVWQEAKSCRVWYLARSPKVRISHQDRRTFGRKCEESYKKKFHESHTHRPDRNEGHLQIKNAI